KVSAFEDEVTSVNLNGDELHLLVNKGTPRGRIVKTSAAAPNIATAQVVVPQGKDVIDEMSRAHDGLYLKIMDGGISRMRRLGSDGRVAEIALPFDGTIGAIFADQDIEGVLFSYSGWLSPTGVWQCDPAGRIADSGITPRPNIDVSSYETTRAFATAKDGTKIPYSLIYKKGTKLDGTN